MWHTNTGDRTLEGAEAKLFAAALWDCATILEESDGECFLGPPAFDRMTYGQKAAVLSIIGKGLLDPKEPICELTAAVESAIAAVFEYIKEEVAAEIDDPEMKSDWRKMILSARKESDGEDLPDEGCDDHEEWLIQVEELSYLILWDYDFEDEDLYVDMPPEDSSRFKEFMRIKDDYFVEIPDDLDEAAIGTAVSQLKALCGEICEE
ncbi:MAG: hypothetical protein OEV87_00540 [Phycisphaerae bacterium]|nr:hypothetical protein [Phycisphaerae bacterium]